MATERPSSLSGSGPKFSLRIYLLAAVTSVIWVAGVVTVFFTETVYADSPLVLARPLATLPPVPPPILVVVKKPEHDLFHGIATWYGDHFNGRTTASGKPFDMYALTACHPTLPFGSLVRVKNLRNNRSVIVQITDRGYLFKGRVIDLSFAAAEELRMTNSGIAPVALEVLAVGPSRHRK